MKEAIRVTLELGFIVVACCVSTALADESFNVGVIGGNNCTGNYLEITAKESTVNLAGLGLHLSGGKHRLRILVKDDSYLGSESQADRWTLFAERQVSGQGEGKLTRVAIPELRIEPYQTKSLLIASNRSVFYSNADALDAFAENAQLSVFSNHAVCGEPFAKALDNRVWNGALFYNESFCFHLADQRKALAYVCL